ncbi:hypothetical protein C8Q72DRAFT_215914 [Fomitopsis betulina]|nr:hypothetical protein C8Q72DRAFT_215914 [Fomitopsis betulina]
MNPLAPSFVPRARSRDSVTPKARPPAITRSGDLPAVTAASFVPSPDLLPCHRQRVAPAKLAAQRRLVESLLPAATAPSRSGSVTPRARRRPLPSVLPVPHEAAVAPAMLYTTPRPSTRVPVVSTMPALSMSGTSAAALLTHVGRVEGQITGSSPGVCATRWTVSRNQRCDASRRLVGGSCTARYCTSCILCICTSRMRLGGGLSGASVLESILMCRRVVSRQGEGCPTDFCS